MSPGIFQACSEEAHSSHLPADRDIDTCPPIDCYLENYSSDEERMTILLRSTKPTYDPLTC